MTNIVVVKQSMKNYLFSVPMGTTLKKDDKVVCDTARGEQEGICFTDSFIVESDTLSQIALLTGATLPLKSVIGKSEIVRFKDKPQANKFEVGKRYKVNQYIYNEGGNVIEITDIIGKYCHYQTIAGKYIPGITATRFAIYSPFADYLTPYTEPITVKEVQRQAKAGEYIKLIKNDYIFNEVGDILKVTSTDGIGVCVSTENQPRKDKICDARAFPWYYSTNEYVVLENYTPPEEPEKHTYKVGDKVEIVKNINQHDLKIGTIGNITDKIGCYWNFSIFNYNGGANNLMVTEEEIKPYTEPKKHVYKEGDYVKIISNDKNSFKYGYTVKLNYKYKADNGWWNCTWMGFGGVSLSHYVHENEFEPFEYKEEK